MPSVLATGTVMIDTNGHEWGREAVQVPGMRAADIVLLTPHITKLGSGPDGKGPLYCAFIDEKKDNGFEVLAYDIQANPFKVTVPVDWAVIKL